MIAIKPETKIDITWGVIGGIIALCICALLLNCTPSKAPDAGSDAGNASDPGLCKLLNGIDGSGTLRTICADVNEVASIVQFILTLRNQPLKTTDAGVDAGACMPLLTICATSSERADAILYISQMRAARLIRDAGHE